MLRELALSGLEWAGISVDRAANDVAVRGRTGEVQVPGSRVKASLRAMLAWMKRVAFLGALPQFGGAHVEGRCRRQDRASRRGRCKLRVMPCCLAQGQGRG